MRRVICWLIGHKPGRELYGYVYPDNAKRSSGVYSVGVIGYECQRCKAEVLA